MERAEREREREKEKEKMKGKKKIFKRTKWKNRIFNLHAA